jgi:hypothetical protein
MEGDFSLCANGISTVFILGMSAAEGVGSTRTKGTNSMVRKIGYFNDQTFLWTKPKMI